MYRITKPLTNSEVQQAKLAKDSLETVKHLCQRLNKIMVHSVNAGLIENLPLAGISKAFQPPIKQYLPTRLVALVPESPVLSQGQENDPLHNRMTTSYDGQAQRSIWNTMG